MSGRKYFFSYMYNKGQNTGFGNCDMTFDGNIAEIKDITYLSEKIKERSGFDGVTILYWREFEPVSEV